MPVIKFPPSVPAELHADGITIREPVLDAATTVREAVLTLPFWKDGADLKRVDAYLEIEDALDAAPSAPSLSIDARNFLKEAMQLRLPDGKYGQVSSVRSNRFYMRILRAVIVADDGK